MKKKKQPDHENKKDLSFAVNKIIYFDKETISNILQEYYKGTKHAITNSSNTSTIRGDGNIDAAIDIKFKIPLIARIKFLFSSKISANYVSTIDKTVTVTSTELSDFEKIKDSFEKFSCITLSDIENSLTFFRVAGNYMRILKGGVKDVDTKEFKNVMDGYEGYEHYKIDELIYVRFNSAAFLSNYKRNDLLNSHLQLYCISVGAFPKNDFNFFEQLNKMQKLSESAGAHTLADIYPYFEKKQALKKPNDSREADNSTVQLYDVVYASISHTEEHR